MDLIFCGKGWLREWRGVGSGDLRGDSLDVEAFGKNEHVKKVFWAGFAGVAGRVLARVVDPTTAQQIVAMITGMGM